jgi:peptide-methionine (S)-S-oxide reductase
LKDHSETVQVQFDPAVISYRRLLEAFWANHDYATPIEKQYKSAIFYHDDAQKAEAEASFKEVEAGKLGNPEYKGKPVLTVIEKATLFYVAELFHQKYFLQCNATFFQDLQKQGVYSFIEDITEDEMSASLNGYFSGHGTMGGLMAEIDAWPVSFAVKFAMFSLVGGDGVAGFKPFDETADDNPLPKAWVGSNGKSNMNGLACAASGGYPKRKFEDISRDYADIFKIPVAKG